MKIGIDASNIRTGGGKKHLEDFVIESTKRSSNIKFFIISNKQINRSFIKYKNVKCKTNKLLNLNSFTSLLSQLLYSKSYFKKNICDIIFVPGGIFFSSFRPFITMSQNMLPYDNEEIIKFQPLKRIKFYLIKLFQIHTFKKSDGIIFLTKYARNEIFKQGKFTKSNIIVPHGIKQREVNTYKPLNKTYEILYVSDFLPYKNQLKVVNSVYNLLEQGYDISLKLVGRVDNREYKKIKRLIKKNKKANNRIQILGFMSSQEIINYYKRCSIFLFASTCENLPFILLEAMSFGLPILTTNKRPMCDIVYNEGVLFDINNPKSIEDTIIKNLDRDKLLRISQQNYNLSKKYLKETSANKALNFIINKGNYKYEFNE
tara:strand:+ start:159 stop:1277 length:1119 start_codon:yes stop_codon:yes gene_type:complete